MEEFQYKFSIKEKNIILQKMDRLGVELSRETSYKYTYFKVPGIESGFSKILRIKESKKGSVVDLKIRNEVGAEAVFESGIKDAESIKKILKGIGCREMAVLEKNRRTFKNEYVRIDLDEINGLGIFLEVKFKEKEKKKAEAFISSLGLDVEKSDKRSLAEIYSSSK